MNVFELLFTPITLIVSLTEAWLDFCLVCSDHLLSLITLCMKPVKIIYDMMSLVQSYFNFCLNTVEYCINAITNPLTTVTNLTTKRKKVHFVHNYNPVKKPRRPSRQGLTPAFDFNPEHLEDQAYRALHREITGLHVPIGKSVQSRLKVRPTNGIGTDECEIHHEIKQLDKNLWEKVGALNELQAFRMKFQTNFRTFLGGEEYKFPVVQIGKCPCCRHQNHWSTGRLQCALKAHSKHEQSMILSILRSKEYTRRKELISRLNEQSRICAKLPREHLYYDQRDECFKLHFGASVSTEKIGRVMLRQTFANIMTKKKLCPFCS